MFGWLYLQHGCPLENPVLKKNGIENVEEIIKTQFLDSTKPWITAICAGKNCFG